MNTQALMLVLVVGCGGTAPRATHPDADRAPLSLAADAHMVNVPAGQFITGSTPEEREQAYDAYRTTAGSDAARDGHWFSRERDRIPMDLGAFRIDLLPVTQAQYAELVAIGGAPAPTIDEPTWIAQGFAQDYATQVTRFLWKDGRPPLGREEHPVVLVTHAEALAYCTWRGALTGQARRLPTADELEKAARGDSGVVYPWGNSFEPTKLNSAVGGPRDTVPVGSFLDAASPYGVLDVAGNVFQWTSTPDPDQPGKMLVKGSAWEDFAGLGRGAAQHGRLATVRHVIVGFRCAAAAQ